MDVEDGEDGDREDEVESSAVDDSGSATNSKQIKQPVLSLVHPALTTAWQVNRKNKMCFIFDQHSPARRFKRGMVYDEAADFPHDTCDGNITETDGPGPGWMPVDPVMA